MLSSAPSIIFYLAVSKWKTHISLQFLFNLSVTTGINWIFHPSNPCSQQDRLWTFCWNWMGQRMPRNFQQTCVYLCCYWSRFTRLGEGSIRDCGSWRHSCWGSQMDCQSGKLSFWLSISHNFRFKTFNRLIIWMGRIQQAARAIHTCTEENYKNK